MTRSRTAPVREVVGTPEPGPLFRLEYCDVRFWYPWHFHPEVEIKHVVRGSGTRIIGDSVESFTDGDLCIVGSETPHCWTSKAVRGRWIRAQVVQFPPQLMGASQQGTGGFSSYAALLSTARRGLQILDPARTLAAKELSLLFEASTPKQQLAHLDAFLAIVADSQNKRILSALAEVQSGDPARHRLAEQILSFIRTQVHCPLTERAASSEFGLSTSAFSRLFKREFGKPFSRYVAELRVARASNLLLSETHDVKEIAKLTGFGTVASLNRHFRAIKMTTPTAYRRRGRELNAGLRAAEGDILRCDGNGLRPPKERIPRS